MDWHSQEIDDVIRRALSEDLGSHDASSLATVPAAATAHARIVAKAPLVLAGLPIVERIFRALDAEVTLTLLAEDGGRLERGSELAKIHGRARAVLAGERTALNFLAHLSGIATLTHRF